MGGGLALLWSSEVTVHIQSYSKHHIDSVVYAENGSYWRCTGVYGHLVAGQKYHTWTLLKRLASFSSLPWLCFGDFNEILLPNEKKGGNNREIKLMYEFREAIRECDLRDMGWKGMPFTWSNKRYEAGLIEERLDRFLCNKSWELKNMQLQGLQYVDGKKIQDIERQIDGFLVDEEIYWKQRSRADWLREGDKNTKFFHAKASSRKRKNKIWGILNEQDEWTEEAADVEKIFCDYFANLYTSTKPSQQQIDAALQGMPKRVTEEMNEELNKPFTEDEVSAALAQMCPTKAPGPDGLPAAFFQKHWQSVSRGVLTTSLHILNEGGTITPVNHTYIALIPKVEKPRKVAEFRPISLSNRLKQVLHNIISPIQSAFIPERLISDNIIIGYECLHKIRHSKSKKHGLVALKLDISKAYDSVEWDFLRNTMHNLGFSRKWVELVMRCVTTSSFSILINGVAKGLIYPQRGLRQGCPLSPYLFILCAEVFSNLLAQAESKQLIHGLKFSSQLSISHLLFADDSLIFTRATTEDCINLKAIFECYAVASGQIFNFDKSSIFFSVNTPAARVAAIKNIFDLQVVSRHAKYLGLPAMVGRKKVTFFNDIKLRVLNKISNWNSKLFSSGGKEVLIKAIAQAIPAYAMSVFRLPIGLCSDIQKAIAEFWWGSKKEKRRIHWAKWDRLCKAKGRGGMGFRDLTCFNQALVAKQGWRVIHFPESLMARVLQARYFKNSSFMQAKLGSNPSFIWRSILWGRQVLQNGMRWRIGCGQQVKIYQSRWIPRPTSFKIFSRATLPVEATVSTLIDKEHKWNENLIKQHFDHEDADKILKIPLPRAPEPDQMIWAYDKQGRYAVKSGY
ncbi:reverse transcriptase domain-containing protein [Citrus sinensis]|uniref:Reverse transcriptase domain-containing protein n=1 Tax=Citrus sinensis TaxID=2711 RepID=A0ACB8K7W8_CITSI|nr:reverse transcriptase domain-containing protein [Citrus sinensis]